MANNYTPGPDYTGANPGFGTAAGGGGKPQTPQVAIGPPRPAWLQNISDDELRRIIVTFNQIYGTNYDPYHPVASGFYSDPRINNDQVQATVTNQATGGVSTIPTVNVTHLADEDRSAVRAEGATTSIATTALNSAATANPKSTPYLQDVVRTAAIYGVPWQVVWGIINHESAGTWDPKVVGDQGNSHGLAQIYQPAHPEVSRSQAEDPGFAIQFIARNLATNFAKYHDWSLAVLAHNSPAAADYMFAHGHSAPKRLPFDATYISGVFGGLEKLGFDFKDTRLTNGQDVGAINGGGSGGVGNAVNLPDPATMRQKAHDYLSKLFFREPTPQEIENLVGIMQSSILESAGGSNGGNVFQANLDPGITHGDGSNGLVNPLGKPFDPRQVTSPYGQRNHGPHHDTHSGIDLAASTGDPVMAAAAGYVSTQEDPHGYGHFIVIKGDDGRTYIYGHLSGFSQGVNGQHVNAGQQIGQAGASGDATGPHLHFEIRTPQGTGPHGAIDPTQELQGGTVVDAPNVQTQADPDQRALDAIRGSSEYQKLYGHKPAYMDEQTYAQDFTGTAQQLLGANAPGEAIRAGLETGQEATTAGYAAGTPNATTNPNFRQLLFKRAQMMNSLV